MKQVFRVSLPLSFDDRVFLCISTLLFPLACFVLIDGFASLMQNDWIYRGTPHDLHRRWVEQACVRSGTNPFDVMNGKPAPAAGRPSDPDYPPWAYIEGFLFILPGWDATRVLFMAWDLTALATLAFWGYQLGNKRSHAAGVMIAFAIIAVGVNRTLLDNGQYTLIVCGFLAAALMLDERGLPYLAGSLLGLSLLKFSLSIPFCVCFVVLGRWKTLSIAVAIVLAAALLSWPLIHVPPWIAFHQSMVVGARFSDSSPTPLKGLIKLGLSKPIAIWLTAAVSILFGTVLMWMYRSRGLPTLFAIAALTARFWAYHLFYDDAILIFLLAVVGAKAVDSGHFKPTRPLQIAFLLVGVSLWATCGYLFRWPVVVAQCVVWIVGLVLLLTYSAQQWGPGAKMGAQRLDRPLAATPGRDRLLSRTGRKARRPLSFD